MISEIIPDDDPLCVVVPLTAGLVITGAVNVLFVCVCVPVNVTTAEAATPLSCKVFPPVPLKLGRFPDVADAGPVATDEARMPLSASCFPPVPL